MSIGLISLSMIACNLKNNSSIQPDSNKGDEILELLVGTYTNSGSKGIYKFDYNASTGTIANEKLVAENISPSFLYLSKNGSNVYSINRKSPGSVSAYK